MHHKTRYDLNASVFTGNISILQNKILLTFCIIAEHWPLPLWLTDEEEEKESLKKKDKHKKDKAPGYVAFEEEDSDEEWVYLSYLMS